MGDKKDKVHQINMIFLIKGSVLQKIMDRNAVGLEKCSILDLENQHGRPGVAPWKEKSGQAWVNAAPCPGAVVTYDCESRGQP